MEEKIFCCSLSVSRFGGRRVKKMNSKKEKKSGRKDANRKKWRGKRMDF